MSSIGPSTRLPFGKYMGKQLREVPTSYLSWMATKLVGSDRDEWSVAAAKILESTKVESELSMQADEFLRQHGVDPGQFR